MMKRIRRKATLASVFRDVKKKTKKKKASKRVSSVRKSRGIELSVEQVRIVDDAIHILARLAANPPKGEDEMNTAVNELAKNQLALTAFRTYLEG